jgi:ribosome-associated heat shock protein Hsp15
LPAERQRIDRWLWHARLAKTRVLAATLAISGHVRVNGQRIGAPARAVRIGDVLTVALPSAVRVLRVAAFAERRGGAEDARVLYDEIGPAASNATLPSSTAMRVRGEGRPTKRERRALDRLRQRGSTLDA